MNNAQESSSIATLINAMKAAWLSEKRHIILEGDGGTGKSYLLLSAFCHMVEYDSAIPLYTDLSKMFENETIKNRIITDYCGTVKDLAVDQSLKLMFNADNRTNHPGFVLLVDGIDETTDPTKYLREIVEIQNEYQNVQIVLASRNPIERLEKYFCEVKVLPLSHLQIQMAFDDCGIRSDSLPEGLLDLFHRPLFLTLFLNEWISKPLDAKELTISTRGEFFDAYYNRLIDMTTIDQQEKAEFALRYLFPAMANDLHREFRFGDFQVFNKSFEKNRPCIINRYKAFQKMNTFENDPAGLLDLLVRKGVLLKTESGSTYRFRHAFHYEYLRAKFLTNEIEAAIVQHPDSENQKDQQNSQRDYKSPEGHSTLPQNSKERSHGFQEGTDGDSTDSYTIGPKAFCRRLPEEQLRWVGEILGEHHESNSNSVIEKFMHHCKNVMLGNCIEILKICRNRRVKTNFDGLQLSNVHFLNTDLRGSTFRGSTISEKCFSSISLFNPIISPDGQYIASKLEIIPLNSYTSFPVEDGFSLIPRFADNNTLIYRGVSGIQAYSFSESVPESGFRTLWDKCPEDAVDLYLQRNILAILSRTKLQLVDIQTQEELISITGEMVIGKEYVVLITNQERGQQITVFLSSERGSLVIAEYDRGKRELVSAVHHQLFADDSRERIKEISVQGDLILFETYEADNWEIFPSDTALRNIYLFYLSDNTTRKVYDHGDVYPNTACLGPGMNTLTFITHSNGSNFLRRISLQGDSVFWEPIDSRYKFRCNTASLSLVWDDGDPTQIIDLSRFVNTTVLYSLDQNKPLFKFSTTLQAQASISPSGNRIAVLFETDSLFFIKILDLPSRHWWMVDLKLDGLLSTFPKTTGHIHELSLNFSEEDDLVLDSVFIIGKTFRQTADYLLKGFDDEYILNGKAFTQTRISISSETSNDHWRIISEDDYYRRKYSSLLYEKLKSEIPDVNDNEEFDPEPLKPFSVNDAIRLRLFLYKNRAKPGVDRMIKEMSHLWSKEKEKRIELLSENASTLAKSNGFHLIKLFNGLILQRSGHREEWILLDTDDFRGPNDEYQVWIGEGLVAVAHLYWRDLRIWDSNSGNLLFEGTLPLFGSFHILGPSEDLRRFYLCDGLEKEPECCYVIYLQEPSAAEAFYRLDCPCSEESGRAVSNNEDNVVVFDYFSGKKIERIIPLPCRVEGCDFRGAKMDSKLRETLRQNGAIVD